MFLRVCGGVLVKSEVGRKTPKTLQAQSNDWEGEFSRGFWSPRTLSGHSRQLLFSMSGRLEESGPVVSGGI